MGKLSIILGDIFESISIMAKDINYETKKYYEEGLSMPETQLQKKYKDAITNKKLIKVTGYSQAMKERGINSGL